MAEDEESKWWSLTFGGLLSVSAVSMVLLVSTLPVLAGQRSVGRGGQVWVLMEAFWILLAVGVGMAAASWLRPHLERRGRRIALGLALGFALVAVGLVTATALGHRERARARQQEDLRFEDGGPDQIGNKYVPFLEQPMVCDVLDLEDIAQRVSTLDPELAAIHVGRELRGICGDVPEPWVGPLLGGLADAADHATPLDERTDQPSLGGPPKLVAGGPIERVLRTWCPTVDEVSARAVSAPASERGYVMYDGCGFGRLGLFEATRPAEIRDVASPLPYGLHLWLLEHGVGVEHARTLTRANLALWASLADPHQHEGVALPRSSSGRHSPEPRPRLELVFDTRSIRRAGEPGRVVELNQGGLPGRREETTRSVRSMLVAGGLERGAATEATILADARVSLDALIAGLTALVDYEIPQVWLATRAACCFQTRYHRLKLHDFSELVSSPARLAITVEGGMVGVFVLEPDFSKGDQADIAIRPVEADSRHRAQEDLDAASLRAEIAKRREARPEIGEVVIAVASGSGLEVGCLRRSWGCCTRTAIPRAPARAGSRPSRSGATDRRRPLRRRRDAAQTQSARAIRPAGPMANTRREPSTRGYWGSNSASLMRGWPSNLQPCSLTLACEPRPSGVGSRNNTRSRPYGCSDTSTSIV